MAQVLGESGRYVTEEAVRAHKRIWLVSFVCGAGCEAALGFLVGFTLHSRRNILLAGSVAVAGLLVILFFQKWAFRNIDALERRRMAMRKGAVGEASVGLLLTHFPDEFRVINDLSTPFGNVDHVVIGPTGVFLIDTKNWRGVVSADGKGELLHNGRPVDKPFVKQFTGRVMGLKDQVRLLSGGLDPYFQALFAFPSARVDAAFGTTGWVHCVRDDRLFDYIVESKLGRKIGNEEAHKVAQAFLALAHMDKDFTPKGDQQAPP